MNVNLAHIVMFEIASALQVQSSRLRLCAMTLVYESLRCQVHLAILQGSARFTVIGQTYYVNLYNTWSNALPT